ncbi:transporter [Syntrophotalea acetylenivorans]|uniref:Transporter n=1 Tax=Syntrophotalea acetylenivorans TaxID=1842532 RepID=A0A1L3GP45_9BACT|nr:OFA family MFS transporter [Syntrophotalea acetylenivorans]APG27448.1 transporter [Syntrophotalea acetylenivorans]
MNQGKEPIQAWITVFAGTAINLCLGILYAWSIWKKSLVNMDLAGQTMSGINAGWTYLTNSQAATPFSLCIVMFMLCMIPGGKIQDKLGPKAGATIGGLCMAAGCIIAGLMKSYTGLIIGFGFMGGLGMGIGYASPTPAALKWFGPHKRGFVAGLVVMGYGGAAIYIAPLARYLINNYGISGSFFALGVFFALVVIIAGQLLKTPPVGYTPPASPATQATNATATKENWAPSQIVKTWQFYVLVIMFILATQSGLLIIGNAAGLLSKVGKEIPFFVTNAWILAAYGGIVNAAGRPCTGIYSDKWGRMRAYALNCGLSALCIFSLPMIIASKSIVLLFLAVGIGFWQYGGLLSLMPSFVADFFGPKNLGINYGLVFIGWGLGAFMPKLGGIIQDQTGSLDLAFYISGVLLIVSVVLALMLKRPCDAHVTVTQIAPAESS